MKALEGTGKAGRRPRVRPAPEPEMSRRAAGTTGEVLTGGGMAEVDDGVAAVFPLSFGAGLAAEGEAVLVEVVLAAEVALAAAVVEADMLREARKGARGEKSRGGYSRPAVKWGCSAVSVLLTRGVVAIV